MNIKHSIGLNLSADAIPGRLHMVQGDANSRTIIATLWDGAQPYSIPEGAAIMVRFKKPDGTGGLYDATESGNKVSYVGSIVTAPVATQMLAVAGDVFAEIDIFGSSSGAAAERLATFRFVVEVAPCVLPDAEIISSDYYNILTADIADAKAAADLAKDYAASAKQSADSAAASVEGAVKYNAPQMLTDAQKQQARDNINASAPYTAGENISISGSVIATKAFPCNPNLLDNWYFGNPVNQRGQTSYTSAGYTIDRWKLFGNNASAVLNGGVQCLASSFLFELIEQQIMDALDGRAVTFSVLQKNNRLLYGTWVVDNSITTDTTIAENETISLLRSPWLGNAWGVNFNAADAVVATKLELGSQQTLAHKEYGEWVLNEIPKFGDQLAECQRYFVRMGYAHQPASVGAGHAILADNTAIIVPMPAEMRAKPSITIDGVLTLRTGSIYKEVSNCDVGAMGPGSILLQTNIGTSEGLMDVDAFLGEGNYLDFSSEL